MSRLYRATTKNKQVRAFICDTKDLVNEAISYHKTSPVASAALGRLLSAGAMMGMMLKNENDLITITIKGDGPIGTVLVTVDGRGHIKGYVANPIVDIPTKPNGKLDVSGAIGRGTLSVVRDLGLKEPYVSQIALVSGEIAEDITYYYAVSEQTNSVVSLGVLVDRDYTIKQSGGFIIQLMPGAEEETISQIESNMKDLPSMTTMLDSGLTPEAILNKVLQGLEPEIIETKEVNYHCDCSRERVTRALISLGKKELQDMIDAKKAIEVNCHFCDKHYNFEVDDLKVLLDEATR